MKQYRNEWKFICAEEQLIMLQQRLDGIVEYDGNAGSGGGYQVNSLYFDDYDDSCLWDNEAGVSDRYKYRIRYYNNQSDQLRLERKEKHNGLCAKTSCAITKAQYDKLLNGEAMDVFWETENALLREFCIQVTERRFAPKVIVAYDRTAYTNFVGNVRITLDRNVSGSVQVDTFLEGDGHFFYVQKEKLHLLEVKFDDVLPEYIKQLVYRDEILRTTFSKYYLAREVAAAYNR